MIYLLTVVIIASLLDRGPSIFASFLSVAVFAFFFVPDYYSFSLANTEYAITLVVMLLVSILISSLTSRIRYQARVASQQERQTAALYEMSRNLTTKLSLAELLQEAVEQISRTFDSQVTILMPDGPGKLAPQRRQPFPDDYGSEMLVANWVYRYGHFAGLGTKTLPKARGFYLPLRASQKMIGVLRLEPTQPNKMIELKSLRFLEALGSQVALAIEREHLSQQAQQAQVQIEAERLRNALLSSVSHDLRTPLTVIAGSASSLLEGETTLDSPTKAELTQTIYEEANSLDRLVHNLLEMSRLQSGEIKINQEWHVLEEVIGCALAQLETQLQDHPVSISLPTDLPLVRIDALLMERVFINLLENAIKYTPPERPRWKFRVGSPIRNSWWPWRIGVPACRWDRRSAFSKNFTRCSPGSARGAGLGLTICRSIIEAHGGHIWAANRPDGGARFSFTIPLEEGRPYPGQNSARDAARAIRMNPIILLIEDDSQIRRFLRASLVTQGYELLEAGTGRDGLALAASQVPEMVLLDLGLPDMEGLEVIKQLRAWSSVPIIILSARGQERDKVANLDAGADDYLTKPFGVGELLARIRVALRRTGPGEEGKTADLFTLGKMRVDFDRRQVFRGEEEIHLTPIEYKLLSVLITPGEGGHSSPIVKRSLGTSSIRAKCLLAYLHSQSPPQTGRRPHPPPVSVNRTRGGVSPAG